MPPPQAGPYPAAAFGQAPQQQQQVPQMQQQPQQLSMGGVPPVSAPPQSLGYGGAAPDVVLSPTNPFASAAGGAPAGANPFSAAPPPGAAAAGSNVEQEWNAFFTR
jgi:hypothetical protein